MVADSKSRRSGFLFEEARCDQKSICLAVVELKFVVCSPQLEFRNARHWRERAVLWHSVGWRTERNIELLVICIAVIRNPPSGGNVVKRAVVYDKKDGAAYKNLGDTKMQWNRRRKGTIYTDELSVTSQIWSKPLRFVKLRFWFSKIIFLLSFLNVWDLYIKQG